MSSILCVTERNHCVSATFFCVRHPVCQYAQRVQVTPPSPQLDFFGVVVVVVEDFTLPVGVVRAALNLTAGTG